MKPKEKPVNPPQPPEIPLEPRQDPPPASPAGDPPPRAVPLMAAWVPRTRPYWLALMAKPNAREKVHA